MTTWTFHTAGELVFGPNALARLPEMLAHLGSRRPALVADRNLERVGLVERTLAAFGGLPPFVWLDGAAEPALALAEQCAAALKPHTPDVVVALGGGSNMDVAKFAAVILAHGGRARDYLGDGKVPGPTVPVVCIPTTAGTGSEVSGAAAFTDTDAHVKVGALSNFLRPAVALVDPLLTHGCPKQVTADSGIDALSHAIEAFTAVDHTAFPLPPGERSVYQGAHPMADLTAERAIRLVGRHLRTAVAGPTNAVAREGMMFAATLGGMAFSNAGVAAVHALEYPVGGLTGCSHGAGNGLLLPHVMRFNRAAKPAAFAQIAAWLGTNVSGQTEEAASHAAADAVDELREAVGVPGRLRDLGVREEQLPMLAEQAAKLVRMLRVNPRPVAAADALAIYRAAF